MLEINHKNYEIKDNNSLAFKIVRVFLMILSGILMFYYLMGIVSYVTSGPSITLVDDLTTEFVVQVVLMGFGLFYLIIAWFRHVSYGIVSLVFTLLYIGYAFLLSADTTVGFLPIAMAFDAVGFIILGLIKKYRKNKEYNVYSDPIAEQYEGPDIFNFRV